jgi:predicted esterase
VIGLHGFGGSPADFVAVLESSVTGAGYILCCPYGPDIRGLTAFGWGDCADAEKRILETVEYLTSNYRIDSTRIVLLGYSQGATMAFCTGLKNAGTFSALVSVTGHCCGDLNKYLDTENAKGISIYMMIGEGAQHLENNKMAERLMKEKGIRAKLVVYPGVGYAFPPQANEEITKALNWIEGID